MPDVGGRVPASTPGTLAWRHGKSLEMTAKRETPETENTPLSPASPTLRPERGKRDQASEAQPEFAPDDPDVAGPGEPVVPPEVAGARRCRSFVRSLESPAGRAVISRENAAGVRRHEFSRFAQRLSNWAGRPPTFVVALGLILLWAISGPLFDFNDTWQLVINTSTTIVTFLMVFLIQNTQNRDTDALHIKIDELLRSTDVPTMRCSVWTTWTPIPFANCVSATSTWASRTARRRKASPPRKSASADAARSDGATTEPPRRDGSWAQDDLAAILAFSSNRA